MRALAAGPDLAKPASLAQGLPSLAVDVRSIDVDALEENTLLSARRAGVWKKDGHTGGPGCEVPPGGQGAATRAAGGMQAREGVEEVRGASLRDWRVLACRCQRMLGGWLSAAAESQAPCSPSSGATLLGWGPCSGTGPYP